MATKAPADHLEKLQVEAKAKLDPNRTEAAEVPWEGVTLYVLPVMKWKTSALHALRESDIELWAEKCLTNGSYDLWKKIDPDLEQAEAFFTAWTEATGESRPS